MYTFLSSKGQRSKVKVIRSHKAPAHNVNLTRKRVAAFSLNYVELYALVAIFCEVKEVLRCCYAVQFIFQTLLSGSIQRSLPPRPVNRLHFIEGPTTPKPAGSCCAACSGNP